MTHLREPSAHRCLPRWSLPYTCVCERESARAHEREKERERERERERVRERERMRGEETVYARPIARSRSLTK
jgi:hypothetical protein